MMPEIDRQKVFWLLKKYSSYTAWNALSDAYAAFSDAYWKAMELSYDDDPETGKWELSRAKQILDGKIAFQKGLPLLKNGDRQVFRNNSRGQLNKAGRAISFSQSTMDPNEFVFDWMKNKDMVFEKYKNLDFATSGLLLTCEANDDPLCAYGTLKTYDPLFGPYNFPKTLPFVPAPIEHLFQTGDEVLFDGIYEPEWSIVDISGANWLDKLKIAAGSNSSPAFEKGCMNYLISGTKAPFYQDGERDKPMPVVWRLIWKDERYLDGMIPEEEAEYLKPVAELAPQQLRSEANHPCPKTGYWSTPAKLGSRRHFTQGEIMPDFPGSTYGITIWMWDQNQSD